MRTGWTARARTRRASVISATVVLAAPLLVAAFVAGLAAMMLAGAAPPAQARGADPGEVTWTRYWDSGDDDAFSLVAVCPNGDVVVAGRTTSPTFAHIVVARYAPSGARRWTRIVAPATTLRDGVHALSTDGDGNTLIAGMRQVGAGAPDILVMKVRANGRVAWTRQIDGGASGVDLATDVAADATGNAYATCVTTTTGGDAGLILKLRARDGATVAHREFTGEHTLISPSSIVVDARGRTYATGIGNVGAAVEMVTVALTPACRVRWTIEEPGTGGDQSAGLHVALARGGALYVAGAAGPTSDNSDIVLARYSTSGARAWRDELDVSEGAVWRETPAGLSVDGYGNAFVAGFGDPGPAPAHGFVARWRPNGSRWYWDPPSSSETDTTLSAVVADGAGGCYAAGHIVANWGDPGDEIEVGYFARFRANGSRAWERANAYVGGRTSFSAMASWPGRGICLTGDTRAPDGTERRAFVQLRRR